MTYAEFKSRVVGAERAYYKSICQLTLSDFVEQADKLADTCILFKIYPLIENYLQDYRSKSLVDYNRMYCTEMLEITKDLKAIKAGVIRSLTTNLSSNSQYMRWLEIRNTIMG